MKLGIVKRRQSINSPLTLNEPMEYRNNSIRAQYNAAPRVSSYIKKLINPQTMNRMEHLVNYFKNKQLDRWNKYRAAEKSASMCFVFLHAHRDACIEARYWSTSSSDAGSGTASLAAAADVYSSWMLRDNAGASHGYICFLIYMCSTRSSEIFIFPLAAVQFFLSLVVGTIHIGDP